MSQRKLTYVAKNWVVPGWFPTIWIKWQESDFLYIKDGKGKWFLICQGMQGGDIQFLEWEESDFPYQGWQGGGYQ